MRFHGLALDGPDALRRSSCVKEVYTRVGNKRPEEEADFLKHFSLGIQNFLKRTGHSTKYIADKLGVTYTAVSAWKYGKCFPDYPNFFKLIVLGLSPLEVMDHKLDIQARINDCEAQIHENKKAAKAIMDSTAFISNFDKISEIVSNIRSKNLHLEEEIKKLNAKEPECHDHLNEKNL